jgi:hypothetical protein
MQNLTKAQLAVAIVAALGMSLGAPAIAADDAAKGADSKPAADTKTEKKPAKTSTKKEKKAKAAGKEGSCKGKEGSCKGKDGSCKSAK